MAIGSNSRGDMLVNFLNHNKLYAINTLFKKLPNIKWIWVSPDDKTKYEIDYILSNNKYIVNDVSVVNRFRLGSDHRMVR